MRVARKLVKAGHREDYVFLAVTDAVFKVAGMPHNYFGGENPCERLTEKPFNHDRLRMWGAECLVYQIQQQRARRSTRTQTLDSGRA